MEVIRQKASQLVQDEMLSVQRIHGGRNSQVYRIDSQGSLTYVLKVYFRHAFDSRDRLITEFSSLQFLWDNGVRQIPRPIAYDLNSGCALYDYVQGHEIPANTIASRDINTAVEFLITLAGLNEKGRSRDFKTASEACYSVRSIVENIRYRLSRLISHHTDVGCYRELSQFLDRQLLPALEAIIIWSKAALNRSQLSFDLDIPLNERTLSPSDFGFHNALRRDNGQLVFLDFEYFGWDDPAKMVVDFLLHPAMGLDNDMKRQFVRGILDGFKDQNRLAERIEIVYPLFGLKWCAILLNEFLPEHAVRREFAGVSVDKRRAIQSAQMAKARTMLQLVMETYEHFPYSEDRPVN